MSAEYLCEPAAPKHAEGLLALFEASGNGCYCGYWYFQGDKNAWLERCYVKPDENRAALVARLESATQGEPCGVVASRDGSIVGWLNLSRAARVQKLSDQRVYRALPCFQAEPGERENVYTVACLYVAEAERGKGVARALLKRAIVTAHEAGGSAIEAFPRGLPDHERLRDDELWLGPETLFEEQGFAAVSDFRPYPGLRLHLR
jgi:GNAT superfamily N-acetyltransferase